MPNLKTIKRKITSITNTRQITKAMKMVAGVKLKKNQLAMAEFRPYADTYKNVILNISKNTVLYKHPFFKKNLSENIGFILISANRGLCGSFNVNLFKLLSEEIKIKNIDVNKVKLFIIGRKGIDFFKKHDHNYDIKFSDNLASKGNELDLAHRLSDKISRDFTAEEISELYIISNHYASTLFQKAEITKILPFDTYSERKNSGGYQIDDQFLISPQGFDDEVIDIIFKDYILTEVHYKILESAAGEQASRMNTMDSATRNATKLINKLTLSYNKARQAAVTMEILDIINGVNVLN
jgi:F-type H+-transporting ATPase subunit gamma